MGDTHEPRFTLDAYVQESRLAREALENIQLYDGSAAAGAFLKKVSSVLNTHKVNEEIFLRLLFVNKLVGEAKMVFYNGAPNKFSELDDMLRISFPEKQKQLSYSEMAYTELKMSRLSKYFHFVDDFELLDDPLPYEAPKASVETEQTITTKLSYIKKPSTRVRSEVDVSYFEPSLFRERPVQTRASSSTEVLESIDFFESSLFEETLVVEGVSAPCETIDPSTVLSDSETSIPASLDSAVQPVLLSAVCQVRELPTENVYQTTSEQNTLNTARKKSEETIVRNTSEVNFSSAQTRIYVPDRSLNGCTIGRYKLSKKCVNHVRNGQQSKNYVSCQSHIAKKHFLIPPRTEAAQFISKKLKTPPETKLCGKVTNAVQRPARSRLKL